MRARWAFAAAVLVGRALSAQTSVIVKDAGPGPAGRYLSDLLAAPGTRVISGDTIDLPRDSTYAGPLVVLAHRVQLYGKVQGDLVVVGGDLFVKPGAVLQGQGMAIGGAAYGSFLATVTGGLVSHRDFTYDVVATPAGTELRYRETYVHSSGGLFSLPGIHGIRLPTYDRSDGVSIGFGPGIETERISADAAVTYRSQIGKLDPSVTLRARVGRKLWVDAFAGRETRTNDDWINGVFSNSLNVLLSGHDERNWYRADALSASASRLFETTTMTSTYSLGAAHERASPVRPDSSATGGPWVLTAKEDDDGILRPNPQVPRGDITSVTGAAVYRWLAGKVRAGLNVDLEVPVSVSDGRRFQQATIDGRIEFPTFGQQRYRFETHAVLTTGDTAPMQRYAYLGGSGTLPTLDLLEIGGDQVLLIESRYIVPLERISLPLIGSPTLTFRHILGGAGVHTLPDLTQIIGLRIAVPFVRAEVLMDTGTRKVKVRGGLSLSR